MTKPKQNSLTQAPYRKRVAYLGDGHLVELGWELLDYPAPWVKDIDWRPNDPFEATLALISYERGRSAARFLWEDSTEQIRYPMFMSSMLELVKAHNICEGKVTAVWHVVKRGQNYGLEAV